MLMTQQVAEYLATQIATLTFNPVGDSNIYLNTLPPDVNPVVAIYTKPTDQENNVGICESTMIKIIYRGNVDLIATETKAKEIFDTLQLYSNGKFSVSGNYIVSCIADGSLAYMSRDKNDRPEFVMRFTIEYEV